MLSSTNQQPLGHVTISVDIPCAIIEQIQWRWTFLAPFSKQNKARGAYAVVGPWYAGAEAGVKVTNGTLEAPAVSHFFVIT